MPFILILILLPVLGTYLHKKLVELYTKNVLVEELLISINYKGHLFVYRELPFINS